METTYPKIALQGTNRLIFVQKHEILYALADGNYTLVRLTDNREVRVLRKLKEVNQLLSDENFIRIHRSHLINLEHIISFDGNDNVIMAGGSSLSVSRDRKVVFIEKFTRI